jgi:AcrR family transcriptional regulator
MTSTRLSPEKWIHAGLVALATQGPAALAAEPLARSLGTTKGSFYWHFADVPAFHAALVRQWHAQALADVMSRLENAAPADARLRAFGHSILDTPVETALRNWAGTDSVVRASVSEVDAARLAFLQHLLDQIGLRNPAFGEAILGTLAGLPHLQRPTTPHAAFDALVDTVIALT